MRDAIHPLIERAQSKVPIADLVGFRIEETSGGRAVASMQAGPQHANPMGTLHGGARCTLPTQRSGWPLSRQSQPMSRSRRWRY